MHNKLLTNSERKRRHLTDFSSCPRCNVHEESVSHILRECKNIDIVWDPGPEDWVTVNTDGSVINQSGNASAGGLIRDHLGHCFLAFSANIGKCSITRAELRGILQGLEFTWSSGYKKVRLQTDSQSAARLILAEDPPLHQHASEVLAIRELLHRNWQVEIQHIFREGNGATDFLANMGHGFRSWYSYGFLFRL
ncbi:Putative ribonuclease H protein At1g65750 [Linum perenne]